MRQNIIGGIIAAAIFSAIGFLIVLASDWFERFVQQTALRAFSPGTIVLVGKKAAQCPSGWEQVGEVTILGNPDTEDRFRVYAEFREGSEWGYYFDYYRFFACGNL